MPNFSAVSRHLVLTLWWLPLAGFCTPALAGYPPGELDFSLQVEHNETRWRYASQTLTSKSSILGVRLQETLAPRLRGSLHTGYLEISQPDNPLAVAQVTTGYYAGVELSLLLLDTRRLRLELSGGYRYQDTDGQDNGNKLNLVWHDTYAQLGVSLPLSERLDLRALGGSLRTSGEQRLSGDTDQLLIFDERRQTYYAAGLTYRLDQTGYLSASWLGGAQDGFRFSFHRGF